MCRYGATQCACQAQQVSAAWVCEICPATIAAGDECSVTGMVCGGCTCLPAWLPGGKRAWTFNCDSATGGTSGLDASASGGSNSSSSSARGGSNGFVDTTAAGGSKAASAGSSKAGGGTSGGGAATTVSANTGGRSAAGGAPTCDESTVGTSPNTLGVNVGSAQHPVPKEIFGVLMEILGKDINGGIYVGKDSSIPNTNGIRNDIIAGFKEAGVGAIEWPGGCAANGYDWEKNTNPSNTMGTDGFMEFARAVGAEPVLVGRPKPEFAASNKKWIEYVNNNPSHPDWAVKYFKIGNEVWGCGGDLGTNVATYEDWYNEHYPLLNTPVNGKSLFLVGATGGIWTVNPNTSNWLTTMLSPGHLADKIQGIEVHDYIYYPDSYPCVGFNENQYYDVIWRADEGQMGPRVKDLRTILDKYDSEKRIKIIEDEWGDWLEAWNASDGWLQQNTVMDALSAALTLNMFIANADRVQMAGLAQAVNVIHSLFLTNSSSGGKDLVKTPTFYVFKLFVPHHTGNAKWAPNTLSSEKITGNGKTFSVLSSGATVNDDKQVNISLANVDLTKSRDVTVTVTGGATRYAMAAAQVITGPAKDSYNDFGKPETVNIQPLPAAGYQLCGTKLKVTLPPKSVVMLTLDAS